jgi:hypothetical protein
MYYVDRLNNGQHLKGRKRLAIGYDFKCVKQPFGSLHYGYYMCKYLRITRQYIVNHEKVSNIVSFSFLTFLVISSHSVFS